LRASCWKYRGVNSPVDFICEDKAIGIELAEWIDEEQARWVNERDRFREQINIEITRRRLARFSTGGAGCTVQVYIRTLPARIEKSKAVEQLIDFLIPFEEAHRPQILRGEILTVGSQELPPTLGSYFDTLIFYGFPSSNLGVTLTRKSSFEAGAAIRSLRAIIATKITKKAENYTREKRRLGLLQLWLVIHYSSPGVFNAPTLK
jgi:hypothetical protein